MSDLGTARGRIVIDPSGAVRGYAVAKKADADFHAQTKKNAEAAKKTGKVVAAAGVGLAAGLGLAIKTAADFEKRISAIGAISGATQKQLDGIRAKALQLGKDTVFSAKQAAQAMEELVKAGVPLKDVMTGAADATVNLAAAGEVDLAQAAEIAGNALNNFNLKGKDMKRVADLIAGAANASAIDVHDFGESMKQSGAAAALVGLSFDDLAVAITAMGKSGIKGSDAGTSLKTFLLNLQPTTLKQTELMKKLGLITKKGGNQFFDASGKIKTMAEIGGVLNKALTGMTQKQKIATLEILFGTDAIRAAAVVSKEGAKGFTNLSKEITKVSAADVAKKKMDNLAGSIEQLKGSIETIVIVIGEGFQPIIRTIADNLTRLGNKFLELDPSTQKLIGNIAAVTAAVLILTGGLAYIIGTIAAGGPVIAGFGAIIGFVLSPVGLLIAALVALGIGLFLLYKKNETFRKGVQAAWEWIQNNVFPVIQQIILGFKAMVAAFQEGDVTSDGFVGAMERVGVALRLAFQWITNSLIPALQSFAGWITGTAIPAVINFAHAVQNILGAAFGWLQDNVFPIFVELADLVEAVVARVIRIVQILKPVFTGTFQAILIIVRTVMSIVTQVIQAALSIILNAWNLFGSNIVDAVVITFNFVKGFIEGILMVIRGVIHVITALIRGDWGEVWNGIKMITAGVLQEIRAIVTLAINGIKVLISTVLHAIQFIWNTAWTLMRVAVSTAWAALKGIASAGIKSLSSIIHGGLNAISRIWFSVWHGMNSGLHAIWDGIGSAVRNGVNKVIDVINWFIRLINHIPGVNISEIGHVGVKRSAHAKGGGGGGGVQHFAKGGITDGPTYLAGEGKRQYPEAVIATDPQYRRRNQQLLMWAIDKIGLPGFARGGIPDLVGSAANVVTAPVRAVTSKVTDFIHAVSRRALKPLFDAAKSMVDRIPGGDRVPYVRDLAKAGLTQLYNWAAGKADADEKKRAAMVGGHIGKGVEQWRGVALSALKAAGAPASWIGSLLRRMSQESGGNPFAINKTDINARRGDPSRGLMQTIGATFNAYAGPYRGRGIYDPFANIYAAIKYTIARYGSGPAGWDRAGGYKAGGILSYLYGGTLLEDVIGIGRITGRRYEMHGGEHVLSKKDANKQNSPLLHIESLTINANTPAEGRAAGKAFLGVLAEHKILTDARIV